MWKVLMLDCSRHKGRVLSSPRVGGIEDRVRSRNDDLVRMTKQIMEVGPKIGEVARGMMVFKETLRYRFHKYLLQRGFVVQANLDYKKLGLKRLLIVAKLAPRFAERKVAMMSALSETCFLTGFSETTLEGLCIMHATIPSELLEECSGLYAKLQDAEVFSEMQILRFEEVRNVPMKPEYYDFTNGAWEYDWHGEEIGGVSAVRSERKTNVERYDMSDLLILKELEVDASQTLVGIAKKLKISHKTALYHYNSHILGRGLIKNYGILWQGAHYTAKIEKAESKRHRYLGVALLVRGLTDGQRARLRGSLNQLPFSLLEAFDPDYYAEFFVPLASYIEFLKRLRELTVRTGTQPEVFILDQSKALRFSIAYGLFDRKKRRWELSKADIIPRFENLTINADGSRRGA